MNTGFMELRKELSSQISLECSASVLASWISTIGTLLLKETRSTGKHYTADHIPLRRLPSAPNGWQVAQILHTFNF